MPRGGRAIDRRLPGGAEPDPAGPTSSSGAALGFLVVFAVLLWKFGLPAIKQEHGRPDRADPRRPRRGRGGQGRGRGVLAEYQAQLADAKAEAGRIIEEARRPADALRRDQEAAAPGRDRRDCAPRAAADIEAAKAQAMADLRGEVATLAIGAAERVVERNLDRGHPDPARSRTTSTRWRRRR